MTNETLDQLVEKMFDPMRFNPASVLPQAREYVQKYIVGEEAKLPFAPPGSHEGFDVSAAFDDAIESLDFDLVAVASKQKPPIDDENGEWDDVHHSIEQLLQLLVQRREEITMAAQEEIADSRVR